MKEIEKSETRERVGGVNNFFASKMPTTVHLVPKKPDSSPKAQRVSSILGQCMGVEGFFVDASRHTVHSIASCMYI